MSERPDENEDLEIQYHGVSADVTQSDLRQHESIAMLYGGGISYTRLIKGGAIVRAMPNTLRAMITEEEGKRAREEFFPACYDLGRVIGSQEVPIGSNDRPFPYEVSMNCPRVFGTRSTVVLTTPSNLIFSHEDAFCTDEAQTYDLYRYILINCVQESTPLSLNLELPGKSSEEIERLQQSLDQMQGLNQKLTARRLDLATAIQSAISRSKQDQKEYFPVSRAAKLYTDKKGPNGGNITLISMPRFPIFIKEVFDKDELMTAGPDPITEVYIERPL